MSWLCRTFVKFYSWLKISVCKECALEDSEENEAISPQVASTHGFYHQDLNSASHPRTVR